MGRPLLAIAWRKMHGTSRLCSGFQRNAGGMSPHLYNVKVGQPPCRGLLPASEIGFLQFPQSVKKGTIAL